MTELFVFSYGSMLNPASIRKTLPHVETSSLQTAWLEGYERSWSVVIGVYSHETHEPKPLELAFLNIIARPKKRTNGILIPVTEKELEFLKLRETGYDCADVSQAVTRPEGVASRDKIYTFSHTPDPKADVDPRVAENYLDIINQGLAYWGKDFAADFWKTTVPHQYLMLKGHYTFRDTKQNKATGRES